MGVLGGQAVLGQDDPAADPGAQVRGPRPGGERRAHAVAAAVEVDHRPPGIRARGGHHLGAQPGYLLLGDGGAARQQRGLGELVQPGALHRPGQRRVQAAPAELPRGQPHDPGRHPGPAERGAGGSRAHAAPEPTVAGRSGMTWYADRSKWRTRRRYRNVWSGQLLMLRPSMVYQLWQPLSHTEVRLADWTQVLNVSCTSGRTSSQARRSACRTRSAPST